MTDQTPSEQPQHITVHDDFQPGDVVLLQHTDGPEFSTIAESVVTRSATSVTFASIEPRIHWHVTIRRAAQTEALHAQLARGIAEAERGETIDRGSFAQHLEDGDDE